MSQTCLWRRCGDVHNICTDVSRTSVHIFLKNGLRVELCRRKQLCYFITIIAIISAFENVPAENVAVRMNNNSSANIYSLYKTHYWWYLMWLPGLSRKPKPAQCSLCWLRGLGGSVKNKAKDPSSHICLVQHKSVWEEEEEKCICCTRKKKSLQCQGKTLCWWWKHWRVLLGSVKSYASESEEGKRKWQRGIMRWSGLRRQSYIVQWGCERFVEWNKGVKYRNRGKFDSCVIAKY